MRLWYQFGGGETSAATRFFLPAEMRFSHASMNEAELPSLNAVASFTAAAKYLSFREAAKSLFVSPGAVSRMVRQLENDTGVVLFRRTGRNLELTRQGEAYYREVSAALDRIMTATRSLRALDGGNVLSLAVLPTFALRILVPKLPGFQAAHPDLLVDMITRDGQSNVTGENIDVSVCIGNGSWPNAEATLICREEVGVYGARARFASGTIRDVGTLATHKLIVHSTRPDAWNFFFTSFAADVPDMHEYPRFEHNFMVIEAAAAGLGLALLPTFIAAGEVAAGRLVQVFPNTVVSPEAYYLVHKTGAGSQRKIRLFTNWLLENVC